MVVIDESVLAQATAGDGALVVELLRLFRTQLALFDAALAATTPDALRPALHRLRGAALAVGAEPLATLLADHEAGLERGRAVSWADASADALGHVLRQTASEVDRLIAARSGAGLAKAGESV